MSHLSNPASYFSETRHFLAPLAGVSDYPFRVICQELGADLTYVEMLSARALICANKRSLDMLAKHSAEKILGVQVTANNPEDMAKAVRLLSEQFNFQTIDINMGCPVQKVVRSGSGSALVKDPEHAYRVICAAREHTSLPLSVKIRIGWDRQHLTGIAVAQAAEKAGAQWLVVHGRTRSENYSHPVDLSYIAQIKSCVAFPVVANGNIFSVQDRREVLRLTRCDGVMVSRGALGNPWIFRELTLGKPYQPTVDEWQAVVLRHIDLQRQAYGDQPRGALCMRKHLLWYLKGWPYSKTIKAQVNSVHSLDQAAQLVDSYAATLQKQGIKKRLDCSLDLETPTGTILNQQRFAWDPKYDMDRNYDRTSLSAELVNC